MENKILDYLNSRHYYDFTPKAAFFDMDGILFDSMPYHAKAWYKVMNALNVPFSYYDAYLNEGRTGADTINQFFCKFKGRTASEEELKTIYARKAEIFAESYKVKRIMNANRFVKRLQHDGLQIFLVTGSAQDSLLDVLNKFYPNVFDREHMITAYDVKKGKPDPEPYLTALKKSGCQPNEVFAVENAPLGIRSAVDAGLFTIAVNTGILKDEVLQYELNNSGVLMKSFADVLKYYNYFSKPTIV